MLVRIMPAVDQAERASVLQLEGQVRSSLTAAAAEYLAAGEQTQVRSMQGMNPMELMLDAPRNYVGERDGFSEVPKGSWLFRTDLRELRYRPREHSSTQYEAVPLGEVAFRVDVAEADVRDGSEIYGVRLVRVSGEEWLVATPQ